MLSVFTIGADAWRNMIDSRELILVLQRRPKLDGGSS